MQPSYSRYAASLWHAGGLVRAMSERKSIKEIQVDRRCLASVRGTRVLKQENIFIAFYTMNTYIGRLFFFLILYEVFIKISNVVKCIYKTRMTFFSLSFFSCIYSSVTVCLNFSFGIKLGDTGIVYRSTALTDWITSRIFQPRPSANTWVKRHTAVCP